MLFFLALLSTAFLQPATATWHRTSLTSKWSCATLNETQISVDATWSRCSCTGDTPLGKVGPMVFNIVRADLTKGTLSLIPAVALTSPPLQPLTSIASVNPRALAAINGGYFWRVDDSTFLDNVCWTKSKEQALQPASPTHRSRGIGDSAVVINSTIHATNCEDPGYARPAALICDGSTSTALLLLIDHDAATQVLTAVSSCNIAESFCRQTRRSPSPPAPTS